METNEITVIAILGLMNGGLLTAVKMLWGALKEERKINAELVDKFVASTKQFVNKINEIKR